MSDLATIFGALVSHHTATPGCPLPTPVPGITWIWAANGIFKRGIDASYDILIRVAETPPTPGLAQLVPYARFRSVHDRIPGGLLTALLQHARRAGAGGPILRPIEQQYFITYRHGMPQPFRLAVPQQDASAMRVSYQLTTTGQRLIDIHSHHGMRAYFSATDDHDDTGLGISAVVGAIFDRSEIAIRANVYGDHQAIPALSILDHLPSPLREVVNTRKDDDADLAA